MRRYYRIKTLRIHPAASVDPYSARITCGGRSLGYAVKVEISLCSRIGDAAQTGCQQESYIDAFVRETVVPCQIRFGKYTAQFDVTGIVYRSHIAVIVHQYIAIDIPFQVGMSIKVAQCTAFFQDKLRFSESASFIGFQFQFVDVICFSAFRVDIVFHQFHDFILIGREGETAVPSEVSPTMPVRQHSLKTVVTHVSGLNIQFVVSRRYGELRIECLIVGIGIIERSAYFQIFP